MDICMHHSKKHIKHFDKVSLGYDENEIADPKDMEKYYSKEKQKKYGVLGIKIKKYKSKQALIFFI